MTPSRPALVGVLLGVVLGTASGCAGDEPPGWGAYETRAVAPAGIVEACPDPATLLPYPGGGELPGGAVGVRLCNGPDPSAGAGDDGSGLLFSPPVDLLETDIEDLVALVNGLEPVELEGQTCSFDLGPTSVYWFLYDDRDPRAVSHQHYGCRNTYVAPDQAGAGGEVLLDTFDRLLDAQRTARPPPGDARVPPCEPVFPTPVSPLRLTGGEVRLSTAVFCTDQGRAVLGPRQVAQLSADLRDRPRPRVTCERADLGIGATIAGRTDWGDAVVLRGRCFSFRAPTGLTSDTDPPAEDQQPWWVLSPVVRRMLTALPLR